MNFLALIIALLLIACWPFGPVLHRDGWFESWRKQSFLSGLGDTLGSLLIIFIPVLALQLLLNYLDTWLFGLLSMGLAIAVLLYAIGRENLSALHETYRSYCRREDFQGAYFFAVERFADLQPKEATEEVAAQDLTPNELHKMIQQRFLYLDYQHWFSVIFYFLLLGPAAALAYRLLQFMRSESVFIERLMFYVDWVPARLLAMAFIVTGNFVESWDEWCASITQSSMPASKVLYTVAMAASSEDKKQEPELQYGLFAANQNEVFSGLLRRSAIFSLVLVSVLQLLH